MSRSSATCPRRRTTTQRVTTFRGRVGLSRLRLSPRRVPLTPGPAPGRCHRPADRRQLSRLLVERRLRRRHLLRSRPLVMESPIARSRSTHRRRLVSPTVMCSQTSSRSSGRPRRSRRARPSDRRRRHPIGTVCSTNLPPACRTPAHTISARFNSSSDSTTSIAMRIERGMGLRVLRQTSRRPTPPRSPAPASLRHHRKHRTSHPRWRQHRDVAAAGKTDAEQMAPLPQTSSPTWI